MIVRYGNPATYVIQIVEFVENPLNMSQLTLSHFYLLSTTQSHFHPLLFILSHFQHLSLTQILNVIYLHKFSLSPTLLHPVPLINFHYPSHSFLSHNVGTNWIITRLPNFLHWILSYDDGLQATNVLSRLIPWICIVDPCKNETLECLGIYR